METDSLHLTSPRYRPGETIPREYTCDGEEISPPLQWYGLPAGTRSLALIIQDPDAPDPAKPERTFVHWVLYNLPANAAGLDEGAAEAGLPPGARQGRNDWGEAGYGGPCPPKGRHRYVHRLFALDSVLPDLGEPSRGELERAMQGHVLAETELVAGYERQH